MAAVRTGVIAPHGKRRTRTSPARRTRPAPVPEASRTPPYINRELSWLEFNGRVLFEAHDERNPILERARFLAIFASNLDEFFQVRVAGLKQQAATASAGVSPDGKTPAEQLTLIGERVRSLIAEQGASFANLREQMAAVDVRIVDYDDVPEHHEALRSRFLEEIFPGPHPARRRPRPPVPLHQHAQPLPGGRAAGARDRRRALRPDQGAADPAAVRGGGCRTPSCRSSRSSRPISTCSSRAWRSWTPISSA